MTFLLNLITAAVLYGTPLLYGTTGEILTEKSGNLNLGVEGMMFMGGAVGLGAAFYYEKLTGAAVSAPLAVVIAIAGSFLAGAAGARVQGGVARKVRRTLPRIWGCKVVFHSPCTRSPIMVHPTILPAKPGKTALTNRGRCTRISP